MNLLNSTLDNPALMSPSEKMGLALVAASLPNGSTIVELGTNKGASSAIMLESGCEPNIYTIDIENKIDPEILNRNNVLFFEGDAGEFVDELGHVRADFILIDGYHSLLSAASDFKILEPLLKSGRAVAFHDCHYTWPGVLALGRALINNGNLVEHRFIDSLLLGRVDRSKPFPSTDLLVREALNVAHEIADSYNMATTTIQGGLNGYLELGKQLSVEAVPQITFAAAANINRFKNKQECDLGQLTVSASDGSGRACFIGKGRQGKKFAELIGVDPAILMDSKEVGNKEAVCLILSNFENEIRQYLVSEKGVSEQRILGDDYILYQYFLQTTQDEFIEYTTCRGVDEELQMDVIAKLKMLTPNEIELLASSGVLYSIFRQNI